MNDDEKSELKRSVTSQVMETLDERIAQREGKRFRNLYIIVGLVSFLGIGVITQLVDFYATKAVDSKLSDVRKEFDSAKSFSQLLSLATKLDLSDSFSNTDRDTVVLLLERSRDNDALISEPAFIALLEKILDSFAASDNAMQVSQIFDSYEQQCLMNPGITATLVQHYGREYLASENPNDPQSKKNYERLLKVIDAINTHNARDVGALFYVLSAYKKNNQEPRDEIKSLLQSYTAFDSDKRSRFKALLDQLSDPSALARNPTPSILRISAVAKKFSEDFKMEIQAL